MTAPRRNGFAIALASLGAWICGAACVLTPDGPPPAMGPPPAAYGGESAFGAPIQAGCTFNGNQLQGAPGQVFQVACPPGCQDQGGLWGTDIYTTDSAICRAGIHAGAISPAGGTLAVRLDAGQPAYRGSMRNGVTS